jgi:hypothetical protein
VHDLRKLFSTKLEFLAGACVREAIHFFSDTRLC